MRFHALTHSKAFKCISFMGSSLFVLSVRILGFEMLFMAIKTFHHKACTLSFCVKVMYTIVSLYTCCVKSSTLAFISLVFFMQSNGFIFLALWEIMQAHCKTSNFVSTFDVVWFHRFDFFFVQTTIVEGFNTMMEHNKFTGKITLNTYFSLCHLIISKILE